MGARWSSFVLSLPCSSERHGPDHVKNTGISAIKKR